MAKRDPEPPEVPVAALIVLAFGMLGLAALVIGAGLIRGDLNYTGVAMCLITGSGGVVGTAIYRATTRSGDD